MNYSYKVTKNRKTIQRCHTHSLRRFTKSLRTINWQNMPCVYLRVLYGVSKDVNSRKVNFYNDGDYFNKTDLFQAFIAFIEK
jgi:hypothetical protein